MAMAMRDCREEQKLAGCWWLTLTVTEAVAMAMAVAESVAGAMAVAALLPRPSL